MVGGWGDGWYEELWGWGRFRKWCVRSHRTMRGCWQPSTDMVVQSTIEGPPGHWPLELAIGTGPEQHP